MQYLHVSNGKTKAWRGNSVSCMSPSLHWAHLWNGNMGVIGLHQAMTVMADQGLDTIRRGHVGGRWGYEHWLQGLPALFASGSATCLAA